MKVDLSVKEWLDAQSFARLIVKMIIIVLTVTIIGNLGSAQAQTAQTTTNRNPRCDLKLNTKWYNNHAQQVSQLPDRNVIAPVNFKVWDWAKIFRRGSGLTRRQVAADIEANDIYKRHILGGVLTSRLTPDPWQPTKDTNLGPATSCDPLAAQLQTARNAAKRYPTAAQAVAAGYVRTGGSYLGGIGVHYQKTSLAGPFNPDQPAQLLYDGVGSSATLAGLSYFVTAPTNTPPPGFAGNNDRWHRNSHWCLNPDGTLIAANVLSQQECTARRGIHVVNPGWWTLHVWVVPGCESHWGVFSASNPNMPYKRGTTSRSQGCGTGKSVNSALDFDTRGTGPRIN